MLLHVINKYVYVTITEPFQKGIYLKWMEAIKKKQY